MDKISDVNRDAEVSRVLIADDCAFNLSAIQCQLGHFKLRADIVLDGQQAYQAVLDRIQSQDPMYDLIMLDFKMPVLDGPSAAREILAAITKV